MHENEAPGAAGSHYVTSEVAQLALRLVAPMVEQALDRREIVGSGFLYVVVMNPGLRPGEAAFEQAILHEEAFGDRTKWDADYAAFARAKARLSWTHGLDGAHMQSAAPHLLRRGDTLLAGAICLDGVVVAASGAHPVYDEVFAATVAWWLRAIARQLRAAETARTSL